MSEHYLAHHYATQIKAGEISRREAIESYRRNISSDFITALLDIDIAIGDINEGI